MSFRHTIAAVCLAVVALTACGSDDDDPEGSSSTTVDDTTTTSEPTTTAPTSTTTSAPTSPPDTTGMDEEEQVRAVVQYAQQLVLLADGPDDPDLARYLTGTELERVTGLLRQATAGGYRSDGERIVEITDVEIVDNRADVRACVLQGIDTVDSSGAVVLEGDDTSIVVRLLLEKGDQGWKVEDSGDQNAEGETEACELDR